MSLTHVYIQIVKGFLFETDVETTATENFYDFVISNDSKEIFGIHSEHLELAENLETFAWFDELNKKFTNGYGIYHCASELNANSTESFIFGKIQADLSDEDDIIQTYDNVSDFITTVELDARLTYKAQKAKNCVIFKMLG